MRGIVIGIFILMLLGVTKLGNDPLGWEARARIEQQTQLQVATIQANAELEALRLEHAAAMERAQFRASLIAEFVAVLPLTIGILCGAILLGMFIRYQRRNRLVAGTISTSIAGPKKMNSRGFSSLSVPILPISAGQFKELQHQAHTTNHRLDVVKQGHHQTALLIDNVTGQVLAARVFMLVK